MFAMGTTLDRRLTFHAVELIRERSDFYHPERNKERSELSPELKLILQKLGFDTLQEAITIVTGVSPSSSSRSYN